MCVLFAVVWSTGRLFEQFYLVNEPVSGECRLCSLSELWMKLFIEPKIEIYDIVFFWVVIDNSYALFSKGFLVNGSEINEA